MHLKKYTCQGNHATLQEKMQCPVCSRKQVLFKLKSTLATDAFTGSTPSIFVGRFHYPHIHVGFLSLSHQEEHAERYEQPKIWVQEQADQATIVSRRSSLVNAHFLTHVKETMQEASRYLSLAKEIGKAKKPVAVEVALKKKPLWQFDFDTVQTPMGPRAPLQKVIEEENPKIPVHVEKVDNALDMKTQEALHYLLKHHYDEHYISRLLSVGALGTAPKRKLVPTRWSITATDDMISKHFIEEIKHYPHADHLAFFGEYFGNYYLIFFFPGPWSFELFETYLPEQGQQIHYTTDHEFFQGRTSYAYNCSGGYYTARLAVAEKLKSLRKQATVFVLRIITPDYKVPLGVWVTREAARKTLTEKPLMFGDKTLMITYLKALTKKKFGFDVTPIIKESKLLSMKQTTLNDFWH